MDYKLNNTGGETQMRVDDLTFEVSSIHGSIHALADALSGGENFIISGCDVVINTTPHPDQLELSEGFIYLNGEVLYVAAQVLRGYPFGVDINYVKNTTYATKVYYDGNTKQTRRYDRAVATIGGAAGLNVETGSRLLSAPKKLNIGVWNMDTTVYVNIAHGISDWRKIVKVTALIYDDTLATLTDYISGSGVINISSTNIQLLGQGAFDSTNYHRTSINRGFIYIEYER
jgi:hypothetical protein